MLGLSKVDRELDSGFIPTEVKLIAIVVFPLVLGLGLLWSEPVRKPTDKELAFGCYLAGGSEIVRFDASGAHLGGKEGSILVPFEVQYAKGYQIALKGSVELVVDDDQSYWKRSDRGWSYLLRFIDKSSLSPRSVGDPEKLDTFQAVTTDSTFVLFERIPASDC